MLEPNAFDRVWLVTVLGEIPHRAAALHDIYAALKPSGVLAVSEVILDPHYQRQRTVRRLVEASGLYVDRTYSNWFAFTMHIVKPGPTEDHAHAC